MGVLPEKPGPADAGTSAIVSPADFQFLFESLPGLYLVLDPEFRVVAASDAYLRATLTKRSHAVGRYVFDVFPDNPKDPEASAAENVRNSFERVRRELVADTMTVQRHDIAQPPEQGGGFATRFWSPRNSPLLGPDGRLRFILHQVEDVTEFVLLQHRDTRTRYLTDELRQRGEQMEAEILRRSRELHEANLALRAANEAKNEFLSRCSHELRTPLNAILGFGELLSLSELDREHHAWVDMILKAGRHLLALMDDVLDISRIEGRHTSLSVEAVPAGALLSDALDLARPLAEAHAVHLAPAPALPPELSVRADRQRLRQVLLNLLSNAVKYNHPSGTVTVAVDRLPGDTLRIGVTDTGRGIPPDALGKLFTPFERLDAAQAGIEGTGLGLALSRKLVQSMGGVLDVSSMPGSGSTFWVELPIADSAALDDAASLDAATLAPRGYQRPMRLLYVEDMVENVRLVEQILHRRPDVTLIPAMLAGIAMELAREHHPDLILLDLHLPDMPGERLLSHLRADEITRDIPVVVLSADATQRHIDEVLARGAIAYLTKPIEIRKLLDVLDRVFGEPVTQRPPEGSTAVRSRSPR